MPLERPAARPPSLRQVAPDFNGFHGAFVISDVVMPGGDDGRDLVERLGRVRPTIKPLYISGHAEADVARGAARSGAFLQKPFTMDVLL